MAVVRHAVSVSKVGGSREQARLENFKNSFPKTHLLQFGQKKKKKGFAFGKWLCDLDGHDRIFYWETYRASS